MWPFHRLDRTVPGKLSTASEMAATANYSDQFQTPARSSKRKRGDNAGRSTPARSARRSAAHNFASQPPDDNAADTTNTDTANAFSGNAGEDEEPANQQQFDLSALQEQQNPPAQAGNDQNQGSEAIDTAAAALGQQYTMTVPPHPAETFMNQPTAPTSYDDVPGSAGGGNTGDVPTEFQGLEGNAAGATGATADDDDPTSPSMHPSAGKPSVGSDEWHKQRKDNHKEVERRRRETINEGINELAKIVPGCEKNKGSILARAVQYIQKLQDDASRNIDKWTFEKLVTEQAISDITTKLNRSWAEKEAWKRVAREAGVEVEKVDLDVGAEAERLGQQGGGGAGAIVAAAQTAQMQAEERIPETQQESGVNGAAQDKESGEREGQDVQAEG